MLAALRLAVVVGFAVLSLSSSPASEPSQTSPRPSTAAVGTPAADRWDAWSPIENARVHVWSDAPEARGSAGRLPQVRVWGDAHVQYLEPGARAEWHSAPAARAAAGVVVIDLKDTHIAPLRNPTPFPLAFPRPGVKKVLENERVVIWDYTWTFGVPTPMHFHDKDVVVIYLADGALRSTEPSGESVVNPHYFGFTKVNAGDRTHTEELVHGAGRAIIVELKR